MAAQSVSKALDEYSSVTGRDVFYDGALAAGRRSSPVRGALTSDEALRELLVGTGLIAKSTGHNSFTLKLDAPDHVSRVAFQSYFAVVQTKVAHALCARAETRPADQDRLVKLWVGTGGLVERAQLVDLAQTPASTREIGDIALRGLAIGVPPADMPQPVVMAILAGAPSACREVVTNVR